VIWRAAEREAPKIEQALRKYAPEIWHAVAAGLGKSARWMVREDSAIAETLRAIRGGTAALHRTPVDTNYLRQIESHARISSALGHNESAARDYDELALYFRSLNSPQGDTVAEQYAKADDLLAGRRSEPTGVALQGAADNSFSSILNALPHDDAKLLHDLQSSTRRVSRIAIARSDVRQFVEDFGEGAKAPLQILQGVDSLDGQLIANWLATPQEKRIFFIGAGEDFALMKSWAQRLETEGYRPFFYKMCEDAYGRLCESKVVGAMFATSGKTIVIDTPSGQKSRYVAHEANAAYSLLQGQKRALLLTPSQLVKAGGAIVSGPITVAGLLSTGQTVRYSWRENAIYYCYRMKRMVCVAVTLLVGILLLWKRRRKMEKARAQDAESKSPCVAETL